MYLYHVVFGTHFNGCITWQQTHIWFCSIRCKVCNISSIGLRNVANTIDLCQNLRAKNFCYGTNKQTWKLYVILCGWYSKSHKRCNFRCCELMLYWNCINVCCFVILLGNVIHHHGSLSCNTNTQTLTLQKQWPKTNHCFAIQFNPIQFESFSNGKWCTLDGLLSWYATLTFGPQFSWDRMSQKL